MGVAAAAGIGAVGAIGSAVIGSQASKSAGSQQAAAADRAAQLQADQFAATSARLQPFVEGGTSAFQELGGFLGLPGKGYDLAGSVTQTRALKGNLYPGFGLKMFEPTIDQLKQTPGYQFTLDQGTQAMTNAAAAMGLGKSGSLLKGIGTFGAGLASTTYQQQFQNYWSQLQSIYNMLSGGAQVGANAAAMTGQAGQQAATTQGNFLTSGAASQAAGTIGSGSAIGNALSSASSLPLSLALLNSLTPQAGAGAGGGSILVSPGPGFNFASGP